MIMHCLTYDGRMVGRVSARVVGVVLQVLHADLVLGPGDQDLQLLVAEHSQPVQSNYVFQSVPRIILLFFFKISWSFGGNSNCGSRTIKCIGKI